MVWVIAFGELFFGDLWCVVWGYGGMRTHFSLLNPEYSLRRATPSVGFRLGQAKMWGTTAVKLNLHIPKPIPTKETRQPWQAPLIPSST